MTFEDTINVGLSFHFNINKSDIKLFDAKNGVNFCLKIYIFCDCFQRLVKFVGEDSEWMGGRKI